MPDRAEAFVATLPVAKFHGVGPKTTVKMCALGIETGADLTTARDPFTFWVAAALRQGGDLASPRHRRARGQGRPARSAWTRERKLFRDRKRLFSEDLTDLVQIEAGVIAMADDVWSLVREGERPWPDRHGEEDQIGVADFQISTRSRSMEMAIQTREKLHQIARELVRSVFPPPKGVRLVGVTLSNFRSQSTSEAAELPFS